MQAKELIFAAALLSAMFASAVAQDTGQPKSGANTSRIGGVEFATPKGDTRQSLDVPDGYQLGPGDQVGIYIVDMSQIAATPFRVDATGAIHVPTIGRLQAQGLTLDGLTAALRERLKSVLVDPDVTVWIVEPRSQPVSILGDVGQPGVHQLQGNKTLFEMLQVAGGIRPEAGTRINITRELKYGEIPLPNAADDASGRFSVASVSVKDFMQGSAPQNNIELKPGDVISVPHGGMIYVLGAVGRSGAYVVDENEQVSALQILTLAGGLVQGAAPQRARILRAAPGSSTSRTETAIDLRKILDGKSSDMQLKANDFLIIPGPGIVRRAAQTAADLGHVAATAAIYRY